jgi:hypothetical protein
MGIEINRISQLHPRLFHMAEHGAWKNIQQYGLCSTTALLDLFKVLTDERIKIERQRRPAPMQIQSAGSGIAVVRDQRPMSDSKLAGCLLDGLTPTDWYQILNGKVFFWLTEARLKTLMAAYGEQPHLVLEVDTAELLKRHGNRVKLSPMNTGTTSPVAFPRGRTTFLSPDQYPFEENARKKGGPQKAIVELTVEYSVPDVAEITVSATHRELKDNTFVLLDTLYTKPHGPCR